MRTLFQILGLILMVAVSFSQSNENGLALFERSDKKLNDTYQKLLLARRSDTIFLKNLRTSQRIWIQFRDAQLTLKYPHHASIANKDPLPLNQAIYLARLTDDRTEVLLEWLKTPTTGLIAHYTFNDDVYDDTGNGYDPILIHATPTSGRLSHEGGAYRFNGHSSIIDCGDILDDVFCAPIAQFSIAGWAKTRTCGTVEYGGGFIIGKNAGGSVGPYQWNVTHRDGFVYAAVFSDPAQRDYLALVSPMSTNQWFHFVLVFDGSLPEMERVKLYVDGQSSNTSVYQHVGNLGTTTSRTGQHLTIGASHAAHDPQSFHAFYDGDIDDIRIYDRALTAAEIEELYFSK
ncbi:MAG TPA: LamG-like jellyroll fold domain-containing protein [Bacteroidota bacterium]|nr:LamG-like jellyroll fold domain-containing protein [Bacteroidota bacterium]